MLKQRMCQAARSASASSDASGATFSCVGCHGDRHLAWRAWCLLLILYAINASFRGKLVTKGGKDSERIFQRAMLSAAMINSISRPTALV